MFWWKRWLSKQKTGMHWWMKGDYPSRNECPLGLGFYLDRTFYPLLMNFKYYEHLLVKDQ